MSVVRKLVAYIVSLAMVVSMLPAQTAWAAEMWTVTAGVVSGCENIGSVKLLVGGAEQGSSDDAGVITAQVDSNTEVTFKAEVIEGYTFVGWYSDQAGASDPVEPQEVEYKKTITEAVELYAKFEADKTALDNKIKEAEAKQKEAGYEENYTQDSREALKKALDKAETAQKEATDAESVKQAVDDLNTAIAGLVERKKVTVGVATGCQEMGSVKLLVGEEEQGSPDEAGVITIKVDPDAEVTFKAVEEDGYVFVGWYSDQEGASSQAESNEPAYKKEIKKAVELYAKFEADKSKLNEIIDEAEKKQKEEGYKENYTQASRDALADALNKANEAKNATDASIVKQAVDDLNTAIAGLVERKKVTAGVATGCQEMGSVKLLVGEAEQGSPDETGVITTKVDPGTKVEIVVDMSADGEYHIAGWYKDADMCEEVQLDDNIEISDDNMTFTISNVQDAVSVYVKFERHDYVEPEESNWHWWEADEQVILDLECSVCGYNKIYTIDDVDSVTVNPTCTDDGKITYIAKVEIEEGKQYTGTKVEKIPAKGHSLKTFPAEAATCTHTGNREYNQCSVCKKYFDKDKKTEIKQGSWTIQIIPHKMDYVVIKKPTETEEGLWGSKCKVCNYTDNESKVVIPQTKLTVTLGTSINVISNSKGCTFLLAKEKKYKKYFTLDKKTGKIKTNENYSKKIKKTIKITVMLSGKTVNGTTCKKECTVNVKIKIPAPPEGKKKGIYIKRTSNGSDYKYKFIYHIPKAKKITVRIIGRNRKETNNVLDKYLSNPKRSDTYIFLSKSVARKLGKKVQFKITVDYGKNNISEARIFRA